MKTVNCEGIYGILVRMAKTIGEFELHGAVAYSRQTCKFALPKKAARSGAAAMAR
jgi:hypothetical protein